ncbi:hypothetical protein GGR55DRAFT_159235 [Xylaria sp. FL0064]|nr:hypothetical protein GGR55DRAFT_159235 [Xylaria sp. FL0064]
MRRKARSLVPLSKRKGWLAWAPSLLFGKCMGDIRTQNPTTKSHSPGVNAPISDRLRNLTELSPGSPDLYRTGLSPSCRRTGSATLRLKKESHCAIITLNTGVTSSENLHSTVDMSLWFYIPVAVLGSLQSGKTIVTNDEIRFQGPLTNDWGPFVSVMAPQFEFGNISLIKTREWRGKGFNIPLRLIRA